MTAPNHHIHYELSAIAEKLQRFSKEAEENEELINKLLSEEHISARLAAEKRVAELEAELERERARVANLSQRHLGQTRQIREMRKALHGEGRNPLVAHAEAVFAALRAAAPDHHLVTREPTDAGEKSALSDTDLRFLYGCLAIAQDKLGRMGCNDWSIENPTRADIYFMQRVEDFAAKDDPGHFRKEIKPVRNGTVYGPANFLVPLYLMSLLKEVHGADLFEGADELVLR